MTTADTDLPAGDFSSWLAGMQAAMRGEIDSDVPCGTCTACCTSSQFIHIRPDEVDTLAHIPSDVLFPAPRLPRGHVVMGYDERGHCPMLVDSVCTIYDHRPRTCRTYDCRVFAAAAIEPDDDTPDDDKAAISRQSRRWRFDLRDDAARRRHAAVRAAAAYVSQHPDALPDGLRSPNATQRAVLAIEAHDLFLDGREPVPGDVRVALARRR